MSSSNDEINDVFNNIGLRDPYERQIYLCYKSHELWPAHFEDSDSCLPKLLACALNARKDKIPVKTRLALCEGGDGLDLSDGDVMIFPRAIVYRGLKESTVEAFVEDILVNENTKTLGVGEKLEGAWVFVCAHERRDKVCGTVGPLLIERFRTEIASNDCLDGDVFVTACTHEEEDSGYGGNVMIFQGGDSREAGTWYGPVTPEDVPDLLNIGIERGFCVTRIFRGQMSKNMEEYWRNRAVGVEVMKTWKNPPCPTEFQPAGMRLVNGVLEFSPEVQRMMERREKRKMKKKMIRDMGRRSRYMRKVCGSVIAISMVSVGLIFAKRYFRKG